MVLVYRATILVFALTDPPLRITLESFPGREHLIYLLRTPKDLISEHPLDRTMMINYSPQSTDICSNERNMRDALLMPNRLAIRCFHNVSNILYDQQPSSHCIYEE